MDCLSLSMSSTILPVRRLFALFNQSVGSKVFWSSHRGGGSCWAAFLFYSIWRFHTRILRWSISFHIACHHPAICQGWEDLPSETCHKTLNLLLKKPVVTDDFNGCLCIWYSCISIRIMVKFRYSRIPTRFLFLCWNTTSSNKNMVKSDVIQNLSWFVAIPRQVWWLPFI